VPPIVMVFSVEIGVEITVSLNLFSERVGLPDLNNDIVVIFLWLKINIFVGFFKRFKMFNKFKKLIQTTY
jgi:hypothetical protein